MNRNKLILGFGFCLMGIFSFLSYLGIISIESETVIASAAAVYSLITVYNSFGSGKRAVLSFSTVLFLVSIIFIVKTHYPFTDTRGTIFSSILFISGTVLFILFIENTKEKIFLNASLMMFLLCVVSIVFLKSTGLFYLVNKVGNVFEIFWPAVLIVLGINVFINRKK